MKKHVCATAILLGHCALVAVAGPKTTVVRQKPFNLFKPGQEISLQVKGDTSGMSVQDYYGAAVPFEMKDGRISFKDLAPGYYEIRHQAGISSFGVTPFVKRSAAESLKEGSRFGLKVFQVGKPGVWWRRPLTWELDECVSACETLGLQWTRHSFNAKPDPEERGVIGTVDLVTKHAMNCVMKIEGMPSEAYDEKRYGPKDEFAKKHNKRGWNRCSVPLKEPYQAWLREELRKLPKSQKTFEIGNEVWDYMSAEEFAELCRLTVPVIREVVPDAVIGADPGNLEWGRKFAKAGGFEGLDAMVIHPYSHTPMPEVRIRAMLRNRRENWERLAGHKLDVYVTEYGWSTAAEERRGRGVSEKVQAQRTARESLMLYAEGCKTLIPHWMADREQDPKEIEHWFGFFRLCGEPKPVVMAHAACARMIDGSAFAGDLILPGAEKGVGSMLFTRPKSWTVALWTRDNEPAREVVVPVKGAKVYGIMGDERQAKATARGLVVTVSGDVTYLVGSGVPPAGLMKCLDRTGELSLSRWFDRVGGGAPQYVVAKDKVAPLALKALDGKASERIEAGVGQDGGRLVVRVTLPKSCLRDGKGRFTARLSLRPERQLDMGGTAIYDYEVRADVKEGRRWTSLTGPSFKTAIKLEDGKHSSGVTDTLTEQGDAFVYEMRIPKKILIGWGAGRNGLMAGLVLWESGKVRWASADRIPEHNYDNPLWKLEK